MYTYTEVYIHKPIYVHTHICIHRVPLITTVDIPFCIFSAQMGFSFYSVTCGNNI